MQNYRRNSQLISKKKTDHPPLAFIKTVQYILFNLILKLKLIIFFLLFSFFLLELNIIKLKLFFLGWGNSFGLLNKVTK